MLEILAHIEYCKRTHFESERNYHIMPGNEDYKHKHETDVSCACAHTHACMQAMDRAAEHEARMRQQQQQYQQQYEQYAEATTEMQRQALREQGDEWGKYWREYNVRDIPLGGVCSHVLRNTNDATTSMRRRCAHVACPSLPCSRRPEHRHLAPCRRRRRKLAVVAITEKKMAFS
jgi:hypothetical protein